VPITCPWPIIPAVSRCPIKPRIPCPSSPPQLHFVVVYCSVCLPFRVLLRHAQSSPICCEVVSPVFCVCLTIHQPVSLVSVPAQEPATDNAVPPSPKKRFVLMFTLLDACVDELEYPLSGKRKARTPDSESEPSVLCI
jgi:hypothetical protein